MQKLLTVSQVSEILGISVDATYRLARQGVLPVIKVGRQIRFDPERLKEWSKSGGQSLEAGWKREA